MSRKNTSEKEKETLKKSLKTLGRKASTYNKKFFEEAKKADNLETGTTLSHTCTTRTTNVLKTRFLSHRANE
jgi:hypothetical protein